ncbi:PEP/pyruvate-binding domain-containing protein [Actinomadura rubrisoli]|nr:PEP/pyruvate-binding domain-containing protein [Actinomadura rubrisoli]
MCALRLPVPPAFVVPVPLCVGYHRAGRNLPPGFTERLNQNTAWLMKAAEARFGFAREPLLVSVRSGAPHSMPGMLDTVLNVDARPTAEGPRKLLDAIRTVLDSWCTSRAIAYRRAHDLRDAGTAVTVQAMVAGDRDDRSGSGVLYSRDPLTSAKVPYGEWLAGRPGEDLASGRHTPRSLDELAAALPEAHATLVNAARILESKLGGPQEVEFTIESGRPWLLQTRALHSGSAATADPAHAATSGVPAAQGIPACPGEATGLVVADAADAVRLAAAGHDVVLARPTTDPGDVRGILAARALVTEVGGATSHAATISRELGRPCVVGCGSGSLAALHGHVVTVDGRSGSVFRAPAFPRRSANAPGRDSETDRG